MHISNDSLRGQTVIAADGKAIGEVAAFVLDTDSWSVQALRVRLRPAVADQVGAARSFFHASAVEVPVQLVQSVGDAVVLSVPMHELRHSLPAADASGAMSAGA